MDMDLEAVEDFEDEKKVRDLLEAGLVDSAEIFMSLKTEFFSPKMNAVYGEILLKKNEPRRAITYLKRGGKSTPRLKWLEAQCLLKCDEVRKAVVVLESIPESEREIKVFALLGKLYESQGIKKNAVDNLEKALELEPYALECFEPLARLNTQVILRQEEGSTVKRIVHDVVKIQNLIAQKAFSQAVQEIEVRLPQTSLYTVLRAGKARFDAEDFIGANACFLRARALDHQNALFMDYAALCLKAKDLATLAHDLMACDKKKAEAWIAAAAYAAHENLNEKAVQLLDKAIALDPRRVTAFQLRGDTLLKLNKPELAVVAYFQANNISKQLRSYRGLVDAYLSAKKYKEALHSAKEAVSLLPANSAVPIALVGKVLATAPEGADKAKRAFQKALQVDPSCVDALIPLVDLIQDLDHAVRLLQTALASPCTQKDVIHVKLGQFYAKSNRVADALHAFHTSLSLNPNNTQAQAAIDSLHSLLPSSPTSSSRRRAGPASPQTTTTRRQAGGYRSSPTRASSHRPTRSSAAGLPRTSSARSATTPASPPTSPTTTDLGGTPASAFHATGAYI